MKYVVIIVLLSFVSCRAKNNNTLDESDSIVVCFDPLMAEDANRNTHDISIMSKNMVTTDTLFIDKCDFNTIAEFVNNHAVVNNLYVHSNLYISNAHSELFISNFGLYNKDGKTAKVPLNILYLIKKYSGMYNYYSREQLYADSGIIKYGLPKDYNYKKPATIYISCNPLVLKRSKWIKVLLIKNIK
ncbi:MAG: hypothetical protein K5854_02985 [Prevotella sp.]|nr:hypothetical protein [Prevotella sp.]